MTFHRRTMIPWRVGWEAFEWMNAVSGDRKKAFSQNLLHRISPPIAMYCISTPIVLLIVFLPPSYPPLMLRSNAPWLRKREKFAFVRRGSWCWLAGMIHYVKRVPLKISFSIMFKNAGSHTPDVCLSFLLIPTCCRLVGGVGWLGCVVCVCVCVCVCVRGVWEVKTQLLFLILSTGNIRGQSSRCFALCWQYISGRQQNIFLVGNITLYLMAASRSPSFSRQSRAAPSQIQMERNGEVHFI